MYKCVSGVSGTRWLGGHSVRRLYAIRSIGCMLLILSLVLLASLAGCKSLSEEPDVEALLCGTWEGTYTPTAAWDTEGYVSYLDLQSTDIYMVLASEKPGTCTGTVVVPPEQNSGAHYGITALHCIVKNVSMEDDRVQMTVIGQAEGLADYKSTFTLTLDGDTLTGEDSGDPQVPTGWISTSGLIALTRTDKGGGIITDTTEVPEPNDQRTTTSTAVVEMAPPAPSAMQAPVESFEGIHSLDVWTRYEENDPHLYFSSGWGPSVQISPSARGTYRSSDTDLLSEKVVSVWFTGVQVRIIARGGPDYGQALAALYEYDEYLRLVGVEETLDLSSTGDSTQVVWTSPVLDYGTYELVYASMRNDNSGGTWEGLLSMPISLDALEVRGVLVYDPSE